MNSDISQLLDEIVELEAKLEAATTRYIGEIESLKATITELKSRYWECSNRGAAYRATITALTEKLEAQRWIPVRERLPEKSDYYWVYGHDPRGKSVARDKRILFRFEYQEWESVSNWIITHWKPITPPKQED